MPNHYEVKSLLEKWKPHGLHNYGSEYDLSEAKKIMFQYMKFY